jgi:hypothetical protein
VYKGSDRTTIAVELQNPQPNRPQENQERNQPGNQRREDRERNEILQYLDARYVGPCEAAWRIAEFEMHGRSPAVTRLQVNFTYI